MHGISTTRLMLIEIEGALPQSKAFQVQTCSLNGKKNPAFSLMSNEHRNIAAGIAGLIFPVRCKSAGYSLLRLHQLAAIQGLARAQATKRPTMQPASSTDAHPNIHRLPLRPRSSNQDAQHSVVNPNQPDKLQSASFIPATTLLPETRQGRANAMHQPLSRPAIAATTTPGMKPAGTKKPVYPVTAPYFNQSFENGGPGKQVGAPCESQQNMRPQQWPAFPNTGQQKTAHRMPSGSPAPFNSVQGPVKGLPTPPTHQGFPWPAHFQSNAAQPTAQVRHAEVAAGDRAASVGQPPSVAQMPPESWPAEETPFVAKNRGRGRNRKGRQAKGS